MMIYVSIICFHIKTHHIGKFEENLRPCVNSLHYTMLHGYIELILIRVYELKDTDIEHVGITLTDERGIIIEALFRKHQHEPDDINESRCIDIFTLKGYFIHLFEEPVDF